MEKGHFTEIYDRYSINTNRRLLQLFSISLMIRKCSSLYSFYLIFLTVNNKRSICLSCSQYHKLKYFLIRIRLVKFFKSRKLRSEIFTNFKRSLFVREGFTKQGPIETTGPCKILQYVFLYVVDHYFIGSTQKISWCTCEATHEYLTLKSTFGF